MGKVVYKKPRLALKEKAKRSTKLILQKQKPTGDALRVALQPGMYRTSQDLDFKGVDTQYGTHVIHTYVAAMVPQLAEALIMTYVPRGEKVLDPFCGGGAVLAECVRNHRIAFGSDINPLALLIAKVKS
ncbi:MAG: DNA methyltransferase, partial [Bacteroidota bacterium]